MDYLIKQMLFVETSSPMQIVKQIPGHHDFELFPRDHTFEMYILLHVERPLTLDPPAPHPIVSI